MIANILLQMSGSGIMGFLPMIGIVIVFYFFMIRPQMNKAKEQKKFVEALKKGDKVVTTAGIHGRIVDINESTVVLEVEGSSKIRFDKSAISLDATKALTPKA
ncbi:preprotein translocase subunit YajC [Paradesertivirga mongoliensis]|uniref:Sec translocon accessory complex subunit YajC n=1 Tax=Paradesertivirga mongoliensis TaxID=2100740 RepID=A0ABW4ZLY3_9SPHI|nr:preprotein translocase subunit YajC [Pedobacter mongoliensis]